MKTASTSIVNAHAEDGYAQLETLIAQRIAGVKGPFFTTDADPEALWAAYLDNLPAHREHYNCHACRRFIEKYGGLVWMDDAAFTHSLVWEYLTLFGVSEFFKQSINKLLLLVLDAKVTGVFLWGKEEDVWGTPLTGVWSHLSGKPTVTPYKAALLTPSQAMAAKKEEYGMLCHALADYPQHLAKEALRILTAEGVMYRSEKAEGVAKWFAELHTRVAGVKGNRKDNLVWQAVAAAPPGFCHIRSTMISTLLDDLKEGLPMDVIQNKWKEKLHPLQYQRPTAPPSEGNIKQAEEAVAKLGLAKSLQRRYATLADVLQKVWEPVQEQPKEESKGGVFDHLRHHKQNQEPLELPPVTMTWEKFARCVLPLALQLEVQAPYRGNYYGLLTAVDYEAPPLLQWDGLEGHPRNPVSCYVYINGSHASHWGLGANAYYKVSAVFFSPHKWQQPEKFAHQNDNVLFAIEASKDSNENSGLGLFPEILRSELHGIRSTIEAYSRKGVLGGKEQGNANGLAFSKGSSTPVTLRVHTKEGAAVYHLDRWD